jgi:hypothetical protein
MLDQAIIISACRSVPVLLRSSLQQGGLGDVRIEMPAPPGEALAIAL